MFSARARRKAALTGLVFLGVFSALAACRKSGGTLGIRTKILVPQGETALAGLSSVEVDVRQLPSATASSAQSVGMATFAPSAAWTIPDSGADPGRPLFVEVRGKDSTGAVVRVGRTRWIDPRHFSDKTYGIYFARPGTWSKLPAPPATARRGAGVVVLDDGRLVLAGGRDAGGTALDSIEIYDPDEGTWRLRSERLATARSLPGIGATATSVLVVAGGIDGAGNDLDTAELFDLAAPTGTPVTAPTAAPNTLPARAHGLRSARLASGSLVFAGGASASGGAVPVSFDGTTNQFKPVPGGRYAAGAGVASIGGKVAIVGGTNGGVYLSLIQIVGDSGSSLSLSTAHLAVARAGASVVDVRTAAGERLLVAGGTVVGVGTPVPPPVTSAAIELVDASGGVAFAAERERNHRAFRAAAALDENRVLLAGGKDLALDPDVSAEVWSASTQREEATDDLPSARSASGPDAAATMPDGTVVVAGGDDTTGLDVYVAPVDPLPPSSPRVDFSITPTTGIRVAGGVLDGATDLRVRFWDPYSLVDERHFAPGSASLSWPGFVTDNEPLYVTVEALSAAGDVVAWGASAVTLDSAAQMAGSLKILLGRVREWTLSPHALTSPHGDGIGTRLADGRAVVVGGAGGAGVTDIVDPTDGSTHPLGSTIPVPRQDVRGAVSGGILYVVGSIDGNGTATSATSMLDLTTATWSAANPLPTPVSMQQVTTLANGDLLETGNASAAGAPLALSERFGGTSWSASGAELPRARHQATRLGNGLVLVTGGITTNGAGGFAVSNTAELYDPAAPGFVATGTLQAARRDHVATNYQLNGPHALVCGGRSTVASTSPVMSSCERYDFSTRNFTTITPLSLARDDLSPQHLLDARVLLIGGNNQAGTRLVNVDVFDPATGAVSAGPPLNVARSVPPHVRIFDGRVIVMGGLATGGTGLDSVEIYTPPAWANPFGY